MKSKVFCMVLMIGLTACSHPVQTTEHAVNGSIESKLLLRGDLSYIKVTDLRAKKTNDFLVVEAEVYNTRNYEDLLYYRFKWFDAKGFQITGDEGWKTVPLGGAQSQNFIGVATSVNVTDFKLELQSPNNTGN